MEKLQNFFLFLSSIIWATSLSSFSKYRPFDTSRLTGKICGKNWRRLIVSNIIINFIPTSYIIFIYFHGFTTINETKDKINFLTLFGTVLFAWALFGTIRIYHAIIFTKLRSFFYNEKAITEIKEKINSENIKSFPAHFIPGLVYWILLPVLGILLIKCSSIIY